MSTNRRLRDLKRQRDEIVADLEVIPAYLTGHKLLVDDLVQINKDIAELEKNSDTK